MLYYIGNIIGMICLAISLPFLIVANLLVDVRLLHDIIDLVADFIDMLRNGEKNG